MVRTRATPTLALCALIGAAVVYAPAIGSGFLADDYPDIAYVARAGLLDLLRDGLWGVPGGAGRYRPVLHLSAKVDWWIWGTSPLGYHVTHVVLHAASAVLLVKTFRSLGAPAFAATAAALLWLVHPLHPEAVSWFAARGNLLAVFFATLAVHGYVGCRRRGTLHWGKLGVTWLAALFAHLSHETVLFLPLVVAAIDAFVLAAPPGHRRLFAGLRGLTFFGSALSVCLVLRVLFVAEAFGGELTSLLAQVPSAERVPLVLDSLAERARLLLAPFHPLLVGETVVLVLLAGTLAILVAALASRPARSGGLAGVLVALAVLALFYLPSSIVVIEADLFTNTRMFYPIVIPWALLLAFAVSVSPLRVPLLLALVAGYGAMTFGVNRLRAHAASTAAEWATAARRHAEEHRTSTLHLFDPPLQENGVLVLENAFGAILAPPFHPRTQTCHVMTPAMLEGLVLLPEKAEFRRRDARILHRRGGEFLLAELPARKSVPQGARDAGELPDIELTAIDVAAVRVTGMSATVLEWRAADGSVGTVAGWPIPAERGGGVIFPTGSDVAWLLAGVVRVLGLGGGEGARVELLESLPPLLAEAPGDGFEVRHGAPPPVFRGRRLGIGTAARLKFLTWPGPIVLEVPVAGSGPSFEVRPEVAPGAGGRFAWSIFEDHFLFAPALARMYWCFEEFDPLGRSVARSSLRRLVPRE